MLTEQQKQNFEMARNMAKEELDQIDREINAELARVKGRLLELQQAKNAVKQIYEGACARMGVGAVIEMKDFTQTEASNPA
jgi:ribosomal protein L11